MISIRLTTRLAACLLGAMALCPPLAARDLKPLEYNSTELLDIR